MSYSAYMEGHMIKEIVRAQSDEEREAAIEHLSEKFDKSPASIRAKLTVMRYINRETGEFREKGEIIRARVLEMLEFYPGVKLTLDEVDKMMNEHYPNTSKKSISIMLDDGVEEGFIKRGEKGRFRIYWSDVDGNMREELEKAKTDKERDSVVKSLARRYGKPEEGIRGKLVDMGYIDEYDLHKYNSPEQVVIFRVEDILRDQEPDRLTLKQIYRLMENCYPNTSKEVVSDALNILVKEKQIGFADSWLGGTRYWFIP